MGVLYENAQVPFDCPNCGNTVRPTVRQLKSGKTITCRSCDLAIDTTAVGASLRDVERTIRKGF